MGACTVAEVLIDQLYDLPGHIDGMLSRHHFLRHLEPHGLLKCVCKTCMPWMDALCSSALAFSGIMNLLGE